MQSQKWLIYLTTFLTYSTLHCIRTCWGSLKPNLKQQPYNFSAQYLGLLDMIVLFTLAISLNLLGGLVEKYNNRKLLFITLGGTILNLTILFLMVYTEFNNHLAYLFVYGFLGILSCLGWPICLYTLSQYFSSNQSVALSMWNSVSQFGDFIAFTLTQIVIEVMGYKGAHSLLALIILLIIICILNYFLFIPKNNNQFVKINSQQTFQEQMSTERAINYHNQNQDKIQANKQIQKKAHKINFITVWCLPGVACTVVAYSVVKSINAIIVFWIVSYLQVIDQVKQADSRLIADAWPLGIVIGAYIGSKFNKNLSYNKFIALLLAAGLLFIFLDKLHVRPMTIEILGLLVVTSFALGGPYNQMSTAVPLKLSDEPGIADKPGGKSAIISLMQGFGQFMCGISVLIVPQIGEENLHKIACCLCFLSAFLLGLEQYRQNKNKENRIKIGYNPSQRGQEEHSL